MSSPGLTDEVVSEGHDFLERVESEDSVTQPDTAQAPQPKKLAGMEGSNTGGSTKQTSHMNSMLEKAKEALHMKK
ncbi:hypothetical protein NKR23_g7797 [Pleurostoma richardsiae]|uniref:Uncharacterized protein n=1 Tax=Pleurostoma richardsiae TaxID=41990 RepID=A0AA38RHD0_9PEZI|nr:hypothetical protein NKR23_g7797 [Pleurostoma richardsiae]